MGITKEGIKGERLLFQLLRNNGWKFFQADAIGIIGKEYYVFECKHQEHYKAPPFDGHGLPIWQVKARMDFQKKTGIKTVLVVFEKPFEKTGKIYLQTLEKLEKGKFIDTYGAKPRRVYNLKSFENDFKSFEKKEVKE